MCVNRNVLPLVKLKDGKRKILFQYTFSKEKIEDIERLNRFRDLFNMALRQYNNHIIPTELTATLVKTIKSVGNIKSFESFVSIPCGHCSECLKVHAREWAIRILKEAEQFENNYFITLTYDDKYLPKYGSLVKDEISKFNKKLKTYLSRQGSKSDFKFYGVGEYGSDVWRPHYHICYFNLEIPDLVFYGYNDKGHAMFTSKFLESVWSKGFIVIEEITIGSACYVARYCDKKKNLSRADLDNMKLFNLEPEFSSMSRRPGVGSNYMNQLIQNVNNGVYSIQYKDNNFSIPKYFRNKFVDILEQKVLEDYQNHNNMISDNLSYKYMQLENLLDVNNLLAYNENEKRKRKNKRGF